MGGQVLGAEREQGEEPALKALEHPVEGLGPPAEEPGGFRDDRPAGEQGRSQGDQGVSATIMVLVVLG
jgi:hypothetical protein